MLPLADMMMKRIEEEEWRLTEQIDHQLQDQYQQIDRTVARNQEKVLSAFWEAGLVDNQLWGSTGYGYGDRGRDQLELIYAKTFATEAALVRPHLVSGTHALKVAFFGLLRPGNTLLYATGEPYDTLQTVIGATVNAAGSLREFGIDYKEVDLRTDGGIDIERVIAAVDHSVRVIAIQRSPGYAWRRALSVHEIGVAIHAIKNAHPHVMIVIDNCYGEFTDQDEPSAYGADLVVGSLIKNPGGGLAPTGGYLVGSKKAVELAAYHLTAPGIGGESGSYENYRLFFQGLFLAPHVVGQALKGNLFASEFLGRMGFTCDPVTSQNVRDIVLKIHLGSKERLIAFCQAIQASSPVDAHAIPEPWQMPGYQDPVIMAAGTFVQGASIELSADGPIRPPYVAYMQGGLTLEHVKIAMIHVMRKLKTVI